MSDSVFGVRALLASIMSRGRHDRGSFSSEEVSGSSWNSASDSSASGSFFGSPHSPAERHRLRNMRFKNPRSDAVASRREPLRQDSGFVTSEADVEDDQIDYLSSIPTELMLRILKFVGVTELCHKIPLLSRYLHHLSNDEFLWRGVCFEYWETKKHTKRELHPRADYYACLESLDCLSDEEIRGVLRARHVEEDEFDEGTRRRTLEKLLRDTVPDGCEDVGAPGSKWKCAYMAAEYDSTRAHLTEPELLAHSWTYSASSSWSYDEDNKAVVVKFWRTVLPDGRVRRTRGPVDGGGWPQTRLWEMDGDEGMQVLHMPSHSTSRTKDWGWRIANGYVTYTSIN